MSDFYGSDIRDLQRRLDKLERVLLEKGILEAPAPPEKPGIETVACLIVAEAVQPWGGNGRWTQATIEINHCQKPQMLSVNFNGFGKYNVRCSECKKTLSTDIRWQVGNAKT
jgi:hypothetical protein